MSDAKILPGLEALAVPIGRLRTLPGNPRRGDVSSVVRSLREFGQHRPAVVLRTAGTDTAPEGDVIIGNHMLLAARQLGWDRLAVVWTDEDETVAKARSLADNRTSDLGNYDDELLAAMLSEVATDPALLAAASYSQKDLDKLIASGEQAGSETESALPPPIFGVIVECSDEERQDALISELLERGFQVRAMI